MPLTTYQARIRRALWFKNNSDLWVGVGRTTPWTDDSNPPPPSPSATDIEEAIIFVQPETVTLCKTVSTGADVILNGQGYAFVIDDDAYTEYARFLYIQARLEPSSGQPYANYRQKGIFSGLTPQSGYESDSWLDPSNVDDVGLLEYLTNTKMLTLGPGEGRIEKTIIEFR